MHPWIASKNGSVSVFDLGASPDWTRIGGNSRRSAHAAMLIEFKATLFLLDCEGQGIPANGGRHDFARKNMEIWPK